MQLHLLEAGAFVVAAVLLLGSPGPGIAALLAIGRAKGFRGAQSFFWALQAGLAIAAGVSAAGLFSVVQRSPAVMSAMLALAVAYLLWLAWRTATAPVGGEAGEAQSGGAGSAAGGFLLGVANPKAYLAFIALFAAYPVASEPTYDLSAKWLLCVLVMIGVDLAWLGLGAALGTLRLSPRRERTANVAMGLAIAATTIPSLLKL